MAEGGIPERSFKDSVGKASGDADECFCHPCKNQDIWVAVAGYCPICQEYLCDHCLTVHKNQRITRGHAILDKDHMPGGEVAINHPDLCVEVCKTHHPEIIRFYCKNHDETGCVDCMTLNHTLCKKDRVQDVSDGFQATNEFKTLQQKLDKFHTELEAMRDTLQASLKHLDTTYDTIQHAITSYRKYINDYLDQVQKHVENEAKELKKKQEAQIKKLIADNASMKTEIEEGLQRMQNDSDDNVNSMFVITKQAKQRLEIMTKDTHEMEQLRKLQQYGFKPSTQIENLVAAKTLFGKLLEEPNINTVASYKGAITVNTPHDSCDYQINDCTLLSSDRMVVADGANNKLKLIDISNKTVISSYLTSSEPCRVVAMHDKQIAVTKPEECEILICNITSTISKERKIQVNNACCGLAYKDGMFAVSYAYPGRVEIMDTHGKILHTVQPKHGRDRLFKEPDYIIFGHDSATVIVSDMSANTVSVVTFTGEILHTYKHVRLRKPCGVAMTAGGVLFVCSRGNSSIHVVSPDLATSKILIDNHKIAVQPNSIAYCEVKYRLYIGYFNMIGKGVLNNTIQVYDLDV